MRTTFTTLAAASALTLLVACGGGGSSSTTTTPSYATSLSYTNPTTGTYQLVKNPAGSSGGTLMLYLVGPSGASISGVSFSASADTSKVTWGTSISNGNTFNIGSAQGVVTKISGTELQGAVSLPGTGSPVTLTSSSVLANVTLTLKGNVSPGTITFTDSGKGAYLDGAGVHNTAVTVGTLSAQ